MTEITTKRLVLRTLKDDESAKLVTSWNPDGSPISEDEARQRIDRMTANHSRNRKDGFYHLCLAIVERNTGDIVGWCGIDNTEPERPATVLFYIIAEKYRNRGYATEAVKGLIDYALHELALPRIDSCTVFENIPSKRVMEKAGMTHIRSSLEEGHLFRKTP